MNHLTVPAYCAFTAAVLLAVLVRAIQTGAHTFTAVFLIAVLYFASRAVVETRKNWPAFKAEMRSRRDARRRVAQQKRYPYTDTH